MDSESSERSPLLSQTNVDISTHIQRQDNGDDVDDETAVTTEEEDKEKFSFFKATRKKKFLLLSLAFVNFGASTGFSLMAPFYPKEALQKGVSETEIGLIFGFFELVSFVTAPIYGNYLTTIGSKFMFIMGVIVCGVCTVLFGLLAKCPDGSIFVVMCFLVRGFQALGASAYITSSFAIISHQFPNHVTTVVGSLETFCGAGMLVGPAIGGGLYEVGGFGLPFFLLGGFVIVCGILTYVAMPTIEDRPQVLSQSIFTPLRSPLCVVTCVVTVTGTFALGYLDPILAEHLGKLNLTTPQIGFVFLTFSAMYSLTAPIWGRISDKWGLSKQLIAFGNLAIGVTYLMLGPSPFLEFFPFEIWSTIFTLVLIGTFIGSMIIPTYSTIIEGAIKQAGMEDNLDTHGVVSGLYNSCWSLGAFIGPMVAGGMVERLGFSWAVTSCAGLFFMAGIAMVIYILIEKHSNCLPRAPLKSCDDKGDNCGAYDIEQKDTVTNNTRTESDQNG